MRLHSMYFICKNNVEFIRSISMEEKSTTNGRSYTMIDWISVITVLNKLANIPGLKEQTTKLYESIPVFVRNKDTFVLDYTSFMNFSNAKNELLSSMNTIIRLYETMNIDENIIDGFDVKMPQFSSINEFSDCIKDLAFIIDQCPYLRTKDGEIKYKAVDIGSFWITFFVIGSASATLLYNLSKIVDTAVTIKSHIMTVKMQNEMLRSMELKNDVAIDVIETFRELNKTFTDKAIHDLEEELGELKDGEERAKAEKSIEKLAEWMNKGLQIYSTIDAPKEVRDLFPQQEEQQLLNDDVIKLLEMKNKMNNEE